MLWLQWRYLWEVLTTALDSRMEQRHCFESIQLPHREGQSLPRGINPHESLPVKVSTQTIRSSSTSSLCSFDIFWNEFEFPRSETSEGVEGNVSQDFRNFGANLCIFGNQGRWRLSLNSSCAVWDPWAHLPSLPKRFRNGDRVWKPHWKKNKTNT